MIKKYLLVLQFLFTILGCGAAYSIRHRVMENEDMKEIAAKYRLNETQLREFNGLGRDDKLRPGDIIFVPINEASQDNPSLAAAKTLPKEDIFAKNPNIFHQPENIVEKQKSKDAEISSLPKKETAKGQTILSWPITGPILTKFGKTLGGESRGIDIGAPNGTPVSAAAKGKVSYSGVPARAFGPLIIVEHENNLFTVYSNLSERRAERGQAIKRGQIIGKSGGPKSSVPDHLHFEVRQEDRPIDPLSLLPSKSNSI